MSCCFLCPISLTGLCLLLVIILTLLLQYYFSTDSVTNFGTILSVCLDLPSTIQGLLHFAFKLFIYITFIIMISINDSFIEFRPTQPNPTWTYIRTTKRSIILWHENILLMSYYSSTLMGFKGDEIIFL